MSGDPLPPDFGLMDATTNSNGRCARARKILQGIRRQCIRLRGQRLAKRTANSMKAQDIPRPTILQMFVPHHINT